MLKELVDYLFQLGRQSETLKVSHPEAEPSHVYYILDPHGMHHRVEADPKPRAHQASDLSAIIGFAVDCEDGKPEIWYSRKEVRVLLQRAKRRDYVTLPLRYSPQLLSLQSLEKGAAILFSQKDFIRLLRVCLAGCVPPALIDALRQIKFRINQTGESEVRHTKASIGRSLEAELQGSGTIPEEIRLTVPIFDGFLVQQPRFVTCAIEVDPQAEKFSLTPLPGQIEAAIGEVEHSIGELLREGVAENSADSTRITISYGNA